MGDTPDHGRAHWPDVLTALSASEARVRADIKDVKAATVENREAIEALELAEARRGQATKDLFRTGNFIRSAVLLVVAVGALALSVVNMG